MPTTPLLALALLVPAQERPPILDVHMHALGANAQGPTICAPFDHFPSWDAREPLARTFMREPPCADPVASPATDEDVRLRTLDVMERLNVYGVLSGTPAAVEAWTAAAPGRFLRGLAFRSVPGAPSPDSVRAMVATGRLDVLAEVTNQYVGIGPDHESMAPYWEMAEALELPVGVHMGPGPPGAAYLGSPSYRAHLGNPRLLEDVLVRHPRLRLYVMHAGFPFLDDMKAVLYAHPQLHVGIGVIVFSQPRKEFYRYLEGLMDAGFGDRILFGSDHMNWPETLERAVRVIEDAPFLSSEEKRAILYENAARFLRLSSEERARHHETGGAR